MTYTAFDHMADLGLHVVCGLLLIHMVSGLLLFHMVSGPLPFHTVSGLHLFHTVSGLLPFHTVSDLLLFHMVSGQFLIRTVSDLGPFRMVMSLRTAVVPCDCRDNPLLREVVLENHLCLVQVLQSRNHLKKTTQRLFIQPERKQPHSSEVVLSMSDQN